MLCNIYTKINNVIKVKASLIYELKPLKSHGRAALTHFRNDALTVMHLQCTLNERLLYDGNMGPKLTLNYLLMIYFFSQ